MTTGWQLETLCVCVGACMRACMCCVLAYMHVLCANVRACVCLCGVCVCTHFNVDFSLPKL